MSELLHRPPGSRRLALAPLVVLALVVLAPFAVPGALTAREPEATELLRVAPEAALPVPVNWQYWNVGSLVLAMDEDADPMDSRYVNDLLETLQPSMVEILGPPLGLDTLHVQIDPLLDSGASYWAGSHLLTIFPVSPSLDFDNDGDGLTDEDGFDGRDNDGDGRIDEDLPNAPNWDGVFLHELVHAFQDDLVNRLPSWQVEGFAEAARFFVTQHVDARATGRRLASKRFDLRLLGFDMIDAQGATLFGGPPRKLPSRPYPEMGYQLAGGSFLLPCLAELQSNGSAPHPLRRLNEALAAQLEQETRLDFMGAVDEQWRTPVDGVFPVSRWLRERAVTEAWAPVGIYLGIGPDFERGGINPETLVLRKVDRTTNRKLLPEVPLEYVNVHGERLVVEGSGGVRAVPELAPGVYRVEARDGDAWAESWILLTPSGALPQRAQEGLGLIFVGADGLPVDVPHATTNGTILERVPGGMLVAPASGLTQGGEITVHHGDSLLGTITVPSDFTRMVTLRVRSQDPWRRVHWTPYMPRPGDPLFVELSWVPGDDIETSLPVVAALINDAGEIVHQQTLPPPAGAEPWHGQLMAPLATRRVDLVFRQDSHYLASARVQLRTMPRPTYLRMEGERLRASFAVAVSASDYRLEYAIRAGGPWTPHPGATGVVPDLQRELAWEAVLPAGSTKHIWLRLLSSEGELLASLAATATVSTVAMVAGAPFPNPSGGGLRWALRLDRPLDLRFEVFDVRGRRVFGPEQQSWPAGPSELRWNGPIALPDLASGAYWLRLSGPGVALSRPVLLLRGATP